ncbi:MAG: SUMF1/EgtB/PvdO family nonheme iron enzyme [Prevotellaceae bacterium]|jgi:formylglycine-generating enzyme required for sulfatase activity|nr:SUMF1/EgtB/PvdO family nonheme iron enzyme [Prevotellaceae bacterium]
MQHLKQGTALRGQQHTYTIQQVLGQGGFGITYLATMSVWVQGNLNKIEFKEKVAIKEFFMKEYCERDAASGTRITVSSSAGRTRLDYYRQRFNKEAKNVSQLDHPHIVKVLEVFEANNTSYIAMEYIEGVSLLETVRQRGALPEAEAVNYIRQVADALEYTHDQKITHLDLKPANILLRPDGVIKVIDFGLSKQYNAEGENSSSVNPAGISEGYSPLELYSLGSLRDFSPASDIYSLGATLCFLLTGRTPPSANWLLENDLPGLPDGCSQNVRQTLVQAMQSKRRDRPQSIAAFLGLLGEVTVPVDPEPPGGEGTDLDVIVVPPETYKSLPPKRSSRRIAYFSAVGIIAGVVIAFALLSDTIPVPMVEPDLPSVSVEPEAPTTHDIIGRVYSAADNSAISGVTVSVKGTNLSTRTDNEGRFSLNEVPLTAQQLTLSKSDYTSQEVAIESNMLVAMNPIVKPTPPTPQPPSNPRQSFEPEMVFVQGGTFTMGSPETEKDRNDEEQHEVTVSSFYIGKYEVTQGQWKAIMGNNPSDFKKGDNYPVESVSWNDIQTYLQKLNAATGKRYRLATEAEWEYAARGGNRSNGYIYSGSNSLGRVAWYNNNSDSSTHPVGQKSANELGIYDMSGNVWEWCNDWYGDYDCSISARNNPKGPSSGSARVLRGGSWYYYARRCRSAFRSSIDPGARLISLGFRVVASAS